MKSSAVSFIIRCSSESISGVKTVVVPVGSRRKPPPGDNVTFVDESPMHFRIAAGQLESNPSQFDLAKADSSNNLN
jgi:hypothetical protein